MPSVWRSGCHCSSPSRTGSESTSSMRMTRAPWGMGPSWHGGPSRARRRGAAARGDARARLPRRPGHRLVHAQRAPAPEVRKAVLRLAAASPARPGARSRHRRRELGRRLGAAGAMARVQLGGAAAVRGADPRARGAPVVGDARGRAQRGGAGAVGGADPRAGGAPVVGDARGRGGGEAPPARAASLSGGARNRPARAGPWTWHGCPAPRPGDMRPRGPARVPGVLEGEQRRVLLALRVPRDRRGPDAGRRAEGLADVAGAVVTPAAVLFDNDGLLLDTEILWTRAELTLFERFGLTFTIEHK